MGMDLSIILWIGGTLFSLGVFAVKVGFGLGYGRIGTRGVCVTLVGYGAIFVLLAPLSGKLMGIVTPLLGRGPYIHLAMAAGMMAWGLYALLSPRAAGPTRDARPCAPRGSALLLVVPCPVCLAAMVFSTWAALSVIKLPAILVGAGLGICFAALVLLFLLIARSGRSESPDAALGLAMIAIGFYYFASLRIPAKIEEARGVYASFADKGAAVVQADAVGVFLLLLVALLAGYFIRQREFKK
jgi:predicted transporter